MKEIKNFVDGSFQDHAGETLDITSPGTGKVIAKMTVSTAADVEQAVDSASKALVSWQTLTVKSRCAFLFKLHHLMLSKVDELAQLICEENGKTFPESKAAVLKGAETLEYACSMPQISSFQGRILTVSRGVECRDKLTPMGIVGCIAPFNFPIMVPMWTIPIALATGNCVIAKPSEKCPMAMNFLAQLAVEAGIPSGVFQVINGLAPCAKAIVENPKVKAVTFVGSSPVAEAVFKQASGLNKKVLALGGAKNHLVAVEDCDLDMAATDIVSSFCGCAGQRCMAASVLLIVDKNKTWSDKLLSLVKEKAAALKPGFDAGCMGPVIDDVAIKRISSYIKDAPSQGAEILLDGRLESWLGKEGTWIAPTILKHASRDERCLKEEIFGPVLSVLVVDSFEEALEIENASEFGNAACIYTSSGKVAEYFSSSFKAGMIGVNIGIPVPREPFSFGGREGTKSKFGQHDITGEGGIRFFTNRQKVTTKWHKFSMGKQEDMAQFK